LGSNSFPAEPEWTSGYALAEGVDLLIHDAQYTDEEYASRIGWGHTSFSQLSKFTALTGARELVTFHHDPAHADDFLDEAHRQLTEQADGYLVTAGVAGLEKEL
jgi:ribonuclease BN (tRNA processing enzyme)